MHSLSRRLEVLIPLLLLLLLVLLQFETSSSSSSSSSSLVQAQLLFGEQNLTSSVEQLDSVLCRGDDASSSCVVTGKLSNQSSVIVFSSLAKKSSPSSSYPPAIFSYSNFFNLSSSSSQQQQQQQQRRVLFEASTDQKVVSAINNNNNNKENFLVVTRSSLNGKTTIFQVSWQTRKVQSVKSFTATSPALFASNPMLLQEGQDDDSIFFAVGNFTNETFPSSSSRVGVLKLNSSSSSNNSDNNDDQVAFFLENDQIMKDVSCATTNGSVAILVSSDGVITAVVRLSDNSLLQILATRKTIAADLLGLVNCTLALTANNTSLFGCANGTVVKFSWPSSPSGSSFAFDSSLESIQAEPFVGDITTGSIISEEEEGESEKEKVLFVTEKGISIVVRFNPFQLVSQQSMFSEEQISKRKMNGIENTNFIKSMTTFIHSITLAVATSNQGEGEEENSLFKLAPGTNITFDTSSSSSFSLASANTTPSVNTWNSSVQPRGIILSAAIPLRFSSTTFSQEEEGDDDEAVFVHGALLKAPGVFSLSNFSKKIMMIPNTSVVTTELQFGDSSNTIWFDDDPGQRTEKSILDSISQNLSLQITVMYGMGGSSQRNDIIILGGADHQEQEQQNLFSINVTTIELRARYLANYIKGDADSPPTHVPMSTAKLVCSYIIYQLSYGKSFFIPTIYNRYELAVVNHAMGSETGCWIDLLRTKTISGSYCFTRALNNSEMAASSCTNACPSSSSSSSSSSGSNSFVWCNNSCVSSSSSSSNLCSNSPSSPAVVLSTFADNEASIADNTIYAALDRNFTGGEMIPQLTVPLSNKYKPVCGWLEKVNFYLKMSPNTVTTMTTTTTTTSSTTTSTSTSTTLSSTTTTADLATSTSTEAVSGTTTVSSSPSSSTSTSPVSTTTPSSSTTPSSTALISTTTGTTVEGQTFPPSTSTSMTITSSPSSSSPAASSNSSSSSTQVASSTSASTSGTSISSTSSTSAATSASATSTSPPPTSSSTATSSVLTTTAATTTTTSSIGSLSSSNSTKNDNVKPKGNTMRAAIGFGALLLVALALCVFILFRRKKQKEKEDEIQKIKNAQDVDDDLEMRATQLLVVPSISEANNNTNNDYGDM